MNKNQNIQEEYTIDYTVPYFHIIISLKTAHDNIWCI